MDIRQLRYFSVIAEEGQISRAAKKLHMAQPPLSQQLRLMEEELGVTLIERKRNGKSMELTEAGKVLYEKAQSVLNLFEESLQEVKETGVGIKGSLSIGVVLSCVSYLPPKIQSFHQQYPSVLFKIWGGDQHNLKKHLINREIEVAIIRLPLEMKGLSMIHIGTESFVLVFPNDWNIFSNRKDIFMKEIEGMPLLLIHRSKGEGVYERIMEELNRFLINPNIVCECPDVNIILSLVASGVGASILPKNSIPTFLNDGVKIVDILDTTLQSETALVWLKDRFLSKTAKTFIKLFQ